MDYTKLMRLKKDVKFLIGRKKSMICNMNNAEVFFISNEVKDIIETAISQKLHFYQLLDAIEDEESKRYMCQVINKLDELGMWSYEKKEVINSEKMNISIDITNDCNLRCRHCCVRAGDKGDKSDLSTVDMLKLVRKISLLMPLSITISGGEPLVREDFCEIVESIRAIYSGRLILMTNATLIDMRMAQFIEKNFDVVDVSLDGADEKSCSLLRGKGTFGKCMEGINNLKKAGVEKITASMVLTEENSYAKQDFIQLCKKYNIGYAIRKLDNIGRAREIYSNLGIKEIIEFDSQKIEENFIKNEMYKVQPQIFACQGAKREFQIDCCGNIFPCGALMEKKFCLGNILHIENLKDYLENRKFETTEGYCHFRNFFPDSVEGCKDCNKNLLCFSCVNEVRRFVESDISQSLCKENQCYYDMYWRNYESI